MSIFIFVEKKSNMHKTSITIGITFAGLSVILGAFGSHALKDKLELPLLQVFETAVRYQMYHALALIILGFVADKLNIQFASYSTYLFIAGIILFSGSLYLISCKSILGIESWKFLGPITPLGGLCFILAWLMFLISYLKK